MRKILALTLTVLAVTYAVVNSAASAAAPAGDSAATLSTDKTDYSPGETVVFTGSGFNPYEQVNIVLKEDPARHADTTLTCAADERGAILNKDYSPTEENIGVSYTATATGQESGRTATVRFTDGGSFSYSPNPLAPINVMAGAAPIVLTRTVNITSPNANNGSFFADVSVTRPGGMPASVTTALSSPSFLPSTNRLSYTASNQTRTVTLTVTIPANAATGSYLVNVIATQDPTGIANSNKVNTGQGSDLTIGITNDQSAPDTTASATAAGDPYVFNTWTNKNVKVTLAATDSGTGVNQTFFKVCAFGDACNLITYSQYPNGGINLNSENLLYAVFFYSTDLAGNAEAPKSVFVKIDKTRPVITLNGAGDMTLTYGDTYSEPGATALDGGGSGLAGPVSITGSVNTLAVGDYTVSYNVSDNAGNAANAVTRTVHVAKATPVITVTPYGETYDGSAHTATGSAKGVFGEPLEGLDLSGTTHTAAGTYGDTWTFTDATGNYNDATGTVSDAIAKAATTTTVTCGAGPFTYDGSAQTPCSVSVTGAGGLNLTPAPTYADNVNAGTATASYTYPGDTNHDGSDDSETFTIDKAPSTTTVNCPASVTYDGSAQTPCAADVTGVGGLSQSLTVSYLNNVNAGTASASASYPGDANHNASSDSRNFIINQAPTTTTVTCGAGPFTYNGSAQTPCTADVTGPGGLNQSLTVSYLNNVNAGTATASAGYGGAANYLPSSDSKNFTINKANATINVTGYTGFYDGAAHGASGTAKGVLGEDLSSLLNFGSTFTNVPGGTANWTFNSANTNTNYNSASGSVSILIKPWTLRGFYSPVSMSLGGVVVWNNIKGGQTVPLKFNLYSGTTEKTSTSDVRGFTVTEVPCSAGLDVLDNPNALLPTTGGTAFRYSGTPGLDGQFVQNWATPNASGKCYKVTMTALDYSTISAFFKTR